MKKYCILLALLIVMSLVACTAPADDNDEILPTQIQEPAFTVSISGLSYPESGTIADFNIEGTLTAPAGLDRLECEVQVDTDEDLNIMTVIACDPYLFEEGMTTAKLSSLGTYFIDQIDTVYGVFATMVDTLGAESNPSVCLDFICYDVEGNTANFTITYEIVSE